MKKIFLASALATSLLAPSLISTAMAEPTPPHAKHGEKTPMPPHKGPKGEHDPKGEHHKMHGMHGMRMAEKLAAMETAIGIRSEQLDVWRKYTSSFMDMVDTRPAPDTEKQDDKIFGEHMADLAIERAEKAKIFKADAEELSKTLDADQLKRMERFSARPMGEHKMGPEGAPDAPAPAPDDEAE